MTAATTTRAQGLYERGRHGIHNLSRPRVIADPSAYIDAVRELGSLFFDEVGQVWVCSGYAQAAEILSDFQRFSSARFHTPETLDGHGLGAFVGVGDMLARQLLFLDPPEHTALRASMREQFMPARVRGRDAELREMVATVLDGLPGGETIDLIGDFAEKLPSALVSGLLGITDGPERLNRWAHAYERLLGSLSTLPAVKDREVIETLDEAMTSFHAMAAERLAAPGADLISSMVAGIGGGPQEVDAALRTVAANCVVLTAGGYQTLTHLVSSALLLLDGDRRQRRLLQEDPGLIESAINEVMRLNGSSQYVARRATATLDFHGAEIRAGQTVIVLLAAANLDPERFTDARAFRVDRDEGRHLGFGLGRHYCVGAPYAERLARWAVLGFLDRFPDHRLDPGPGATEWGMHANTRCLSRARVLLRAPVAKPEEREGAPAPLEEREDLRKAAEQDTPARVEEWNDTETPLGQARCWHQAFERHAAARPDAVAVVDQGVEHTYGDLDRRANALARHLREHGVEPERVVAVVMSRSVEFVIAVLAIGKAGGAFLLADRDCPPERLRAMAAEASVHLLLVDERTGPVLADLALPAETLLVTARERAQTPPVTGVAAGNTAYIVFTSGTTGRPKAIVISHEAVVNLHVAQRRVFHIGAADRVLQFFSPNFDGCVFDLTMALLSGAALVVGSDRQLTVGPGLARLMRDTGVTVATMTPSVWAALPVLPLPRLRVVAAAGERLSAGLVRRWSAPARRVLNLYGPAETAVWTTWHDCGDADEEPPIGRPVANKRVYLLDQDGRPVPVGREAELHIGGIGVGRYLGRPDLMENRFLPDPFCAEPGRLLYRTGDICRWRADGVLEYVGRRDRQTKIRGQRVELEEVERVIEAAPGVLACAVSERDQALEAVVVANSGAVTEDTIRDHLAARLHSGMIPARFTFVDELPRTITGKRAALLDPGSLRPTPTPPRATARPVVDPLPRAGACPASTAPGAATAGSFSAQTRLTWRVAQFFATCLTLPQRRVRADADFFSLGGDSLAVSELLVSVEKESGLLLDVEQILDEPNPAGIAAYVLARQGEAR
ncbi:amino acid adenylation domain-containing protein [Nonomuraea angiospora]|uniref:amino acid adenylation domain-containing protein n=1 Tax=Nonomuraea angiospora TaxID=46172 RepID=UPI0033E56081